MPWLVVVFVGSLIATSVAQVMPAFEVASVKPSAPDVQVTFSPPIAGDQLIATGRLA
jgi:hypothetical protein